MISSRRRGAPQPAGLRRADWEKRSRFAGEALERIENLFRGTEEVIAKMARAGLSDVIQVSFDKLTEKKTTTKINALDAQGMAALI